MDGIRKMAEITRIIAKGLSGSFFYFVGFFFLSRVLSSPANVFLSRHLVL